MLIMTSADKFGVIFSIAFAAAMIALMGGLLQADTVPTAPSVAAPAQTYSPPPTPTPATAPTPSMTPQAAPQSSSSENLKYTIRGGVVESVSPDEHHNAVKIIMDSRLNNRKYGELILNSLPVQAIPYKNISTLISESQKFF